MSNKPNYLTDSRFRSFSTSGNRFEDPVLGHIMAETTDGSYRYKKENGRSNSNIKPESASSKALKFAGRNTLQFPKRERFNEDTESVIAEQRAANAQKLPGSGLTA